MQNVYNIRYELFIPFFSHINKYLKVFFEGV